MKFCSYCKTQNPDTAQFCMHCGRSLNPSTPGSVEPYEKKKTSFWWIPASVCFVCAVLVAFAIYRNGKKQGNTLPASAEPSAELSEYTPMLPEESAGTVTPELSAQITQYPQTSADNAEVAEDDASLYNLMQGMWVSEADFEGCCIRLLVHGNAAAISVANPLTEDAEPRAWKDNEWDSEPWDWGDCSIRNETLTIRDSQGEVPFKIYPVSDYEVILEYNFTDTEEGEKPSFYCIQPPEKFSLADFLIGTWVSDGIIENDDTVHGMYIFNMDGTGEIGRAKENSDKSGYDYEQVFTIIYTTDDDVLSFINQNEDSYEYGVDIEDTFTIHFGEETFRRINQ